MNDEEMELAQDFAHTSSNADIRMVELGFPVADVVEADDEPA